MTFLLIDLNPVQLGVGEWFSHPPSITKQFRASTVVVFTALVMQWELSFTSS